MSGFSSSFHPPLSPSLCVFLCTVHTSILCFRIFLSSLFLSLSSKLILYYLLRENLSLSLKDTHTHIELIFTHTTQYPHPIQAMVHTPFIHNHHQSTPVPPKNRPAGRERQGNLTYTYRCLYKYETPVPPFPSNTKTVCLVHPLSLVNTQNLQALAQYLRQTDPVCSMSVCLSGRCWDGPVVVKFGYTLLACTVVYGTVHVSMYILDNIFILYIYTLNVCVLVC